MERPYDSSMGLMLANGLYDGVVALDASGTGERLQLMSSGM